MATSILAMTPTGEPPKSRVSEQARREFETRLLLLAAQKLGYHVVNTSGTLHNAEGALLTEAEYALLKDGVRAEAAEVHRRMEAASNREREEQAKSGHIAAVARAARAARFHKKVEQGHYRA